MSALHLHLDFETRSHLDIKKVGLDNYARSAEVLCLAWAVGDGHPQLWAPTDGPMPVHLRALLTRPEVQKPAWNAAFERAILLHVLGIDVPPEQWLDPAVMARYAAVGASLDMAGKVLGLGAKSKNEDGKRLMRMFSFAGKRGHRRPEEAKEDFELYCDYCRQDVVAERAVMHKLTASFTLPAREVAILRLDRIINERGIPVDRVFVANAQRIVATERARLMARLREITGLDNPNSCMQMLGWLQPQGYPFGSLGAAFVRKALAQGGDHPAPSMEALRLRQQLSRSSTKKLDAIEGRISPDGRVRYNYKFYGAHTGRWSGEGVQLQNLPRGVLLPEHVTAATEEIRRGSQPGVLALYGNVLDVVSSCMRSAFRAPDGQVFVVADLSAIEVRVLAWLSGCEQITQVYREGRDIYVDFAARYMYHVAYDQVTKRQRQIAKSAVLGCGYQLSGGEEQEDANGDTVKTGLWGYAENMGIELTQAEARSAVAAYRAAYPQIVRYWYNTQDAAIAATHTRGNTEFGRVTWRGFGKLLAAVLPAGRRLHYIRPEVRESGGRNYLSYEGVNSLTKKWGRRPSYGGHLTENIVQAVARDVLAEGMLRADEAGFRIVGHTHDEIICLESAVQCAGLEAHKVLADIMTRPIAWAPDLLLGANGYTAQTYRK